MGNPRRRARALGGATLAVLAGTITAVLAQGAGAAVTTTTTATTGTSTGATVSMAVTPATPKLGSSLTLSASNVPAQGTSLPQSITVSLPGFSTATAKGVADSTAALCTAAEASSQSCPATSQVSSGSATIVATLMPAYQSFNPGPITATTAGYLEPPTTKGAVADVDLVFTTSESGAQSITGYLEASASGLTLSIPDLSSLSSQLAPYKAYIQSVNLQSLSLKLAAHHTASTVVKKTVRKKVREGKQYVTKTVVEKSTVKTTNYLLNNPTTCTSAGWTGTLTLGYSTGPTAYTATAPCRK